MEQPWVEPWLITSKLGAWPNSLLSPGLSFLIFKIYKKINDPCKVVGRIRGDHECKGLSPGLST